MINVAIVGATGYTGRELIEILLNHPHARISSLSSRTDEPVAISELFPRFKNRIDCACIKADAKAIANSADAVFLALPHTASMDMVPYFLKAGKKVIDLSADYRIKDIRVYQEYYKVKHKDVLNLKNAVYGLPELFSQKIKGASLVANPGCYPTACVLAVAPALSLGMIEPDSIIIDAKSGVSGAGKKVSLGFTFNEINEDFRAYKVNEHQHAPEINQTLSGLAGKKVSITFVPHLLPVTRGILATVYAKKRKGVRLGSVVSAYPKFYKNEPFVRICQEGKFPALQDVCGTNFCDIGIKEEKDSVIIISAIDNLIKGASGQAVHNFNLMYGLNPTAGLL